MVSASPTPLQALLCRTPAYIGEPVGLRQEPPAAHWYCIRTVPRPCAPRRAVCASCSHLSHHDGPPHCCARPPSPFVRIQHARLPSRAAPLPFMTPCRPFRPTQYAHLMHAMPGQDTGPTPLPALVAIMRPILWGCPCYREAHALRFEQLRAVVCSPSTHTGSQRTSCQC
jgi:hypothetical protein